MIEIKIIGDAELIPVYSTAGSAGADIKSSESGELLPGEFKIIKTGIRLEIPEGYEVQLRPRSGLALKHGVTMLNSPGTIDSDYRGEIGVILINHGKETFFYKRGDRIGQMILSKYDRCEFECCHGLSETRRGEGGFGHTGV